MAELKEDYRKEERINGIVYDMSPSADYRHGIVNSNIHAILKQHLKNSLCLSFMENLDYRYQPEKNNDYVIPDVMLICDRKHLKGGAYTGVPRFIAETLSPGYSPERQNSEKRNLSGSRSFGILDRIPKRKGSRDLLSGTGQLYSEIQLYFAG